jgi:hypothetical protein
MYTFMCYIQMIIHKCEDKSPLQRGKRSKVIFYGLFVPCTLHTETQKPLIVSSDGTTDD